MGSSPRHTLNTRASRRGAPLSALMRARLSSWVQNVASRVASLGHSSFKPSRALQPLHHNYASSFGVATLGPLENVCFLPVLVELTDTQAVPLKNTLAESPQLWCLKTEM